MAHSSLYGGRDPRQAPAYGIAEAARFLRIPPATLRSWVLGRTYPRQHGTAAFEPLIRAADGERRRLSFHNLVEAHVLRALRTRHEVSLAAVRPALAYAERELGIERLLLSQELLTHAGDLFLERYGELINLSRSGQLAIKKVLESYLERVERDESALPIRLFPFLTGQREEGRRSVVIDPRVAFGQPSVVGTGIRAEVLAERIDAGESVADLAADYGLEPEVVEEAVVFARAA